MVKCSWKRMGAIATCSFLLAGAAAGGIATLPARAAGHRNSYTVDLEKPLQTFNGWGLSLSWWATEIGDWTRIGSSGKEKREEIAEALYGKTGLDLNIARYNVGGGDDPTHTHMSDDRNTPGWRGATTVTAGNTTYLEQDDEYYFGDPDADPSTWADWTEMPDYRQLWVLNWIQNNYANRDESERDDYMTEYYSNSPPYWMTVSGCSSGGEGGASNLTNDDLHNKMFVDYFLDVYEYLVSKGFKLDNLQPFNEPMGGWGYGGDQEGAHFEAEQKAEIFSILIKEMEERGITDVAYNVGDECETDTAAKQYKKISEYTTRNGMSGQDILNGAGRLTYHIYGYQDRNAQLMYRYAKEHGQEIEMSEICWSGSDDAGDTKYDPDSLTTGFMYTQSIINTVKYGGVDSYVFWQGMEDMAGQMKGGTNYGLIQGVYYDQATAEGMGVDLAAMGLIYQDYVLAKSYYMSGQYTKYIRPGYTFVDVNEGNTMAAISPDGETLVVVRQNNNDADSLKLELNGFAVESAEKVYTDKTHSWTKESVASDNGAVYDTVPAKSVTTYILHGTRTKGEGYFSDDSRFVKKQNLEAIETALQEGGDAEQYYRTGFNGEAELAGDGSANENKMSANAKYFGDTKYSNNGYAVFHFKGTGFGISACAKSDAGKINVWIDKEPTEAAEADSPDCYASDKEKGKLVYRKNGLEDEWHTVYLAPATGSKGSWVNIDGVHIYTSADVTEPVESNALQVTETAAAGGKLAFTYTAETLTDYTVYAQYRLEGAETWTKSEQPVTEDKGTVESLENGKRYEFRLIAEKEEEEPVVSAVRCVEVLPQTQDVLYFADCGTVDPDVLATGAVLGELQSVSDRKADGADLLTGKTWGYTGNPTALGHYSGDEAMTSMWSKDQFGTNIEYTFVIPDEGTYDVTLGFWPGPSNWGSRTVAVVVDGSQNKDVTISNGAYHIEHFSVTTSEANHVLTVAANEKNDAAPQISVIVIAKAGTKLPLYTSGVSNYNSKAPETAATDAPIGSDVTELAKEETFTVWYSDGTSSDEAFTGEDMEVTITFGELLLSGERFTAEFSSKKLPGVHPTVSYVWRTISGEKLYYNIDCAFTGNGKSDDGDKVSSPPDDGGADQGIYQSTTHDRVYGEDTVHIKGVEKKTEWGYLGNHFGEGCYYVDNKQNKWSIREGKDEGASLTYKMTGFEANELLVIETGGHVSNWGDRVFTVYVNGVAVGDVEQKGSTNGTPLYKKFSGEKVKADEAGELTVKIMKKEGEGPQVGYIKVWNTGGAVPLDKQIGADKTMVTRDGTVNLKNLNTAATVYVYDENNVLLHAFTPSDTTQEITVANILPATSYELHFVQAELGSEDEVKAKNFSDELVVGVPGVDIVQESKVVRSGEATVVTFLPHAAYGVTSLELYTSDGVRYDLTEGFYFRAYKNDTYRVLLKSGGAEFEKEFAVENIDEVDFGMTYDGAWKTDSATVTFTPETKFGVAEFKVDESVLSEESGTYTFTANGNGAHTAYLTTQKGNTYEYPFEVTTVDSEAPAVEFTLDLSAEGVGLSFAADSASGGTLYVTVDGGEQTAVTDLAEISLEKAGKYEFVYTNGAGVSTAKYTYYVTHGTDKAQLASVTVGEDGTVTVAEKTKAAPAAKLYRAGESEAISSMKAEKAGRYYLEIGGEGETEVVVFEVSAPPTEMTGDVGPQETEKANDNLPVMIAGIVIGCAAIAAAAVVCPMLIKGRKKV